MELITNICIFLKDNKTSMLLGSLCILMIWLIINWFQYLRSNYFIFPGTSATSTSVEGFETNKYSTALYDNPNTPLTSHTVDLPINTNYTCSNFCGPKASCSKSGQQCSTDVDCYSVGCQSLLKTPSAQDSSPGPEPNDDGIIFSTDLSTNAGIIDENATIKRGYQGLPVWEDDYNATVKLNNDQLKYEYASNPSKYKYTPHYKTTETATGLFYDIGPTAANDSLN
jgi:hypothetical protein